MAVARAGVALERVYGAGANGIRLPAPNFPVAKTVNESSAARFVPSPGCFAVIAT